MNKNNSVFKSVFFALIFGTIFSLATSIIYLLVKSIGPIYDAVIATASSDLIMASVPKIWVIGLMLGMGAALMIAMYLEYDADNVLRDKPRSQQKFVMGSKSIIYAILSTLLVDFGYLYMAFSFQWNTSDFTAMVHLILGIFTYPTLMAIMITHDFNFKLNKQLKDIERQKASFLAR